MPRTAFRSLPSRVFFIDFPSSSFSSSNSLKNRLMKILISQIFVDIYSMPFTSWPFSNLKNSLNFLPFDRTWHFHCRDGTLFRSAFYNQYLLLIKHSTSSHFRALLHFLIIDKLRYCLNGLFSSSHRSHSTIHLLRSSPLANKYNKTQQKKLSIKII